MTRYCRTDNKIKLRYERERKSYPLFYRMTWEACLNIPAGQTRSYAELAAAIGRPKSARAVALALKHNPFAPFVPCHRVICSDGSLGGYSGPGGINAKMHLLMSEGIAIESRGSKFFVVK